jgi:ubiquinone/menaquinone biosynthesis C-methylase UbiE
MSTAHDIKSYSKRLQGQTKAELYARRFEQGSRRRIDKREQRAVRRIFASLPECHSVLDVPSGAGRFIQSLGQGRRRVIEMDVAFEILTFAQAKAVQIKADAQLAQADASRLPLVDGAVDCVFSNRLLHHIHSPEERKMFLREFHRVSRRYAVVSFFNYKGFARVRGLLKRLKGRVPPYANQPTQEQFLAEAAEVGFRVLGIVPTGMPWVSQKYVVLEKA